MCSPRLAVKVETTAFMCAVVDCLLLAVVNSCVCCYPLFISRLCGSLGYYDVAKEKKISLKLPQPLQVYDRIFHKVTTTDDPIIREVNKFVFQVP